MATVAPEQLAEVVSNILQSGLPPHALTGHEGVVALVENVQTTLKRGQRTEESLLDGKEYEYAANLRASIIARRLVPATLAAVRFGSIQRQRSLKNNINS